MDNMTVKLKSCDDDVFEVDALVAYELQAVRILIEDWGMGTNTAIPLPNVPSKILNMGTDTAIPLPNVSSKILFMVLEYCKYHVESQKKAVPADEIKRWDARFMQIDLADLIDLMVGADYLHQEDLLELVYTTFGHMLQNATPEEIRKILNIKNDFTREEEEQVRRENQWAFIRDF